MKQNLSGVSFLSGCAYSNTGLLHCSLTFPPTTISSLKDQAWDDAIKRFHVITFVLRSSRENHGGHSAGNTPTVYQFFHWSDII